MLKVQRALAADGPSFINILSPCPRGWRHDSDQAIALSRLSAQTCMWPLYEVRDGTTWKLSYRPSPKRPVTDWLASQGRFAHLLRPENRHVAEALQERIDRDWKRLLEKCGAAE
jgi:pyruvate ferredoxin oxidoreductase beta subunit